jgi:predicted HicB family RNase H-like nuclease
MESKLTLRIEEKLIKAAKEYSAKKGKSLSRLVADFFFRSFNLFILNENNFQEVL